MFTSPLPSWLFLHQCLVPFHFSMAPAGVISRSTQSLTIDLAKHKQHGVNPSFAFRWREGLLGLGFSLVLKPRQGWGRCILLDLVNLAKDIIPVTRMCEPCSPCSTCVRQPLGMAQCSEAPHPLCYPVSRFYPSLASFSLPNFAHQRLVFCVISLSVRLNINHVDKLYSPSYRDQQTLFVPAKKKHELS